MTYCVSDSGTMPSDMVNTHVFVRDVTGYNETSAGEVSRLHLGDADAAAVIKGGTIWGLGELRGCDVLCLGSSCVVECSTDYSGAE